jgi:anti-sigma factor RsiW
VGCEQMKSVLHGYWDRELDAAGAEEFERHLPSCADCAAALKIQEGLRFSMQDAGLYERAPAGLRRRLEAEMGAAAGSAAASVSWTASWRWLAVAAALLLAVAGAWRLIPGLAGDTGEAGAAAAIVDAHLRSLQPGHLTDVVSSDQHTVKPWFDGKIDFAPPVRDFVAEGYPLQGGRLDVVQGRSVAVVVYARRKHLINVFVWPTTGKDSSPSAGSRLGYNWMRWRKGGMEMWAVSDLNPTELGELQRLLEQ